MNDLRGTVYIVTGAGALPGLSAATTLYAVGACVVLAGDTSDKLSTLARRLGTRSFAMPENVSSADGWLNVVRRTLDRFGRIDGVVNDGSIYTPCGADDSDEAYDRMVNALPMARPSPAAAAFSLAVKP
jgi:NAD(P)-dependent dehydrogenase (short-subunit alcohol dehydrogenase family)